MPARQRPEAFQAPSNGMVASAHPLASEAGAGILRQGVTAFDAAIAVAVALNVVEPFMSGLASQGLATAWVAAERRVRVLDFVPRIPRSFPIKRFDTREQLKRGPLAMGLPGNLAGWAALHGTYGRLPWAALLAPAIRHAADGFRVLRFGAEEICRTGPGLAEAPEFGPEWRAAYPFQHGIEADQTIRQPDLAATFGLIAQEGPQTRERPAAMESCRPRRRRCCTITCLACRSRTPSRRRVDACGTAAWSTSRAASNLRCPPRCAREATTPGPSQPPMT